MGKVRSTVIASAARQSRPKPRVRQGDGSIVCLTEHTIEPSPCLLMRGIARVGSSALFILVVFP
ncbi:MAG: hypothetical protein ABFD25_11840, partial [Clostridiaceae bacterium]